MSDTMTLGATIAGAGLAAAVFMSVCNNSKNTIHYAPSECSARTAVSARVATSDGNGSADASAAGWETQWKDSTPGSNEDLSKVTQAQNLVLANSSSTTMTMEPPRHTSRLGVSHLNAQMHASHGRNATDDAKQWNSCVDTMMFNCPLD